MIHELIDGKKKSTKGSSSVRNPKANQDSRVVSEGCNFEGSDCENKEPESSSPAFIPPWLRHSLGLNQKTNLNLDWSVCLPNFTALGHTSSNSEPKPSKISQKAKESSQNVLDLPKTDFEKDPLKLVNDHFEVLSETFSQEFINTNRIKDNAETISIKSEKNIFENWSEKENDFDLNSDSSSADEGNQIKTNQTQIDQTDVNPVLHQKSEDKKLKMKHKNKMKKRASGDQKMNIRKDELDLILEMKAKEALGHFLKKDPSVNPDVISQPANLGQSNDLKLTQKESQFLQGVKNRIANSEKVEKFFERVKELSPSDVKPPLDTSKVEDKKLEPSEEKNTKEVLKTVGDKDILLSTDDENDIKRFSDFLSKNNDVEEKRKCLEEVRNYFERKRRSRMTKRRILDEAKAKLNVETENPGPKVKSKETHRAKKTKFALCTEEALEKVVDETFQKFVETYNIEVSPALMNSMKKNIIQTMINEQPGIQPRTVEVKKRNTDVFSLNNQTSEKYEARVPDSDVPQFLNEELGILKDIKKKKLKTAIEAQSENDSKQMRETDIFNVEKLKRLKKEFDVFLYSVQPHIDVTNLKLQSIILEKEEQTASSKNVQFVYNFTKKSLEPEKGESHQASQKLSERKNFKDVEMQTGSDFIRRNVKIQTLQYITSCEKSLQTEEANCIPQSTQTLAEDSGISFKEIKDIKSCDVIPGLYRMVKSKDPGKFYLYPEHSENNDLKLKKSSSFITKKKSKRKQENISKDGLRIRKSYNKNKGKLKKSRNTLYAVAHLRTSAEAQEKNASGSGTSVNCLYFRNFDQKNSDSISSKKDLTDENATVKTEDHLTVGDSKEVSKDHLGCVWFWNGQKIYPGSDLKTHVEDLLKEKLKLLTESRPPCENIIPNLSETTAEKDNLELKNDVEENSTTTFTFSNSQIKNNSLELFENESQERLSADKKEISTADRIQETVLTVRHEKLVKNAATQNSDQSLTSLNNSMFRIRSKTGSNLKKKLKKHNIIVKPVGKKISLKKAEELMKVIEDLKNAKLDWRSSKKEIESCDSEYQIDDYTSSNSSKKEFEDPLTSAIELRNKKENMVENFENELEKLISVVDRGNQTYNIQKIELSGTHENPTSRSHRHLDLIESVLNRVNKKERESLWDDLRSFIRTKIGRDINDEGAKEVCIEIEQDMPNTEHKKLKNEVLAKGLFTKSQGDFEVEIDLTLDDLEKILRQRQKKSRRKVLYQSKSKKYLSNSTLQSDLTRENLRRYQKYLQKMTELRENLVRENDGNSFLQE